MMSQYMHIDPVNSHWVNIILGRHSCVFNSANRDFVYIFNCLTVTFTYDLKLQNLRLTVFCYYLNAEFADGIISMLNIDNHVTKNKAKYKSRILNKINSVKNRHHGNNYLN